MSSIRVALTTLWPGPAESGPRDVLTQALAGEPVQVLADLGGWLEVRLPWQPGADGDGYRGFLRAGHVGDAEPGAFPARGEAPLDIARGFVGVEYLWGGLSRRGIDCSGLVHLSHRLSGMVVPRDARDQQAAAVPVALDEAEPGDLFFFAHDEGPVSHVGYVVGNEPGRRRMLHAPEGTRQVEEALVSPRREADLVAAGRFVRT